MTAAAPTLVRCVNCIADQGHDWLEYVAALGGLAGVLVSAIALVIAVRSATDAKASAQATERIASDMHAEHVAWERERAKRPDLVARLELMEVLVGERRAIIRGGIENVGDRDADRLLVNFLVPASVQVRRVGDRHGNGVIATPVETTTEPFVDGQEPLDWRYPNYRTDVEPHISAVTYFELVLPGPGRYPLKFKAIHHEAPGGGTAALAILELTDDAIGWAGLDDAPEAAGLREQLGFDDD